MSSAILENAIIRLLRERPFYGHLLLNFRRELRPMGKAAGVTIQAGQPVLYVDPEYFGELTQQGQGAMIEHCLKHLLHLHMARRKGRNTIDWDLACDMAINSGIANLPAAAPQPEQVSLPQGLAAEEYYDLISTPFSVGNLTGRGAGAADRDAGLDTGQGEDKVRREKKHLSPLDQHQIWQDADSTPLTLAEEVIRHLVKDAVRKSDDVVPEDLRMVVSQLLAPSAIPWREILRQFVATAGRIGRTSTWMRSHRRFEHMTPGIRKKKRLNLLVGVDVSESTDQEELREAFARELMSIAQGREAHLTVVYANSRVCRIDAFNGRYVSVESYHGGGFTDLRPVFDYAKTMNPLPAAVIYLTDGQGPAPETMEFPTLWVLTAEGKRPVAWGTELRLAVV